MKEKGTIFKVEEVETELRELKYMIMIEMNEKTNLRLGECEIWQITKE